MTPLKDLIPHFLKDRIKRQVKQLDILLNENEIDFRELLADPFDAFERAHYHPILLNFNGNDCRGLQVLSFPITNASKHPFVLTANEYLNGVAKGFSSSSLAQYYEVFQPTNSAETLGLEKSEAPAILKQYKGVFKFPWESVPSVKDVKERRELPAIESRENNCLLDWTHGDSMYGPVSSEKGNLEFYRISALVDSLRKNKYEPYQHIPGWLLVKDDNYKVLLRTGQHRAAVFASLDENKIPVAIYPNRIVCRSEVRNWPWVKKKLLSEEKALEIFDRVFEGEQPHCLKKVWSSQ